jgi:hypothetical protein
MSEKTRRARHLRTWHETGEWTDEVKAARAQRVEEKQAHEEALWEDAKRNVANDDPNLTQLALERIREDPLWWMETYVKTADTGDNIERIKAFPKGMGYFRFILDEFDRSNVVIICKTRQMFMSWFISAYAGWKVLFFSFTEAYVQCTNEDTVAYFVNFRQRCIYNHLPEWQKNPKANFSTQKMRVEGTESFLSGIPSGSGKAHGRTPSIFVGDELARQEEGQDQVTDVLPAIHGKALFVGISTPKGKNFYYYLCNPKGKKLLETVYPIPESPKTRIERYEGYSVIFLHYTADPAKRSKEWREAERSKFFASGKKEKDWDQQYEMSFEIEANPRLYPTYDPAIHERSLKFNAYRPLIVGLDFGKRRPAAAFMQQNSKNQIEILWAILGGGWDIHEFVTHIQSFCKEHYKPVLHEGREIPIRYEWFCDHAGTQEGDKGSTVKILWGQYRIHPRSRYSKPEERAILIADYLKVRKSSKLGEPDEPGMLINKDCALLCEAFRGGLQSKPDAMGNGTGIPFKDDFYDNVGDAIGYPMDMKFGTHREPPDEWALRVARQKRRREQQKFNKVTGYSYAN